MDMNGLTRIFGGNTPQSAGRAAVEALKAGADLILIPGDLDGAYNGVLQAVGSGELTESRIDRSVPKFSAPRPPSDCSATASSISTRSPPRWSVRKTSPSPSRWPTTRSRSSGRARPRRLRPTAGDRPRIHAAKPGGAIQAAASAARLPGGAAVRLSLRRAPAGNHLLVLVFTDDVRSDNGRVLVREIRDRVPDAHIIYIDDTLAPALAPHVLEAAATAERIVAAVYVIPSAGRAVAGDTGSPALERGPATVLANLLKAANAKTVVVALGNPYLIAHYPAIQNYVCTFSSAPVSEQSAAKFLFGEIPARGHLPITIPGIAQRVPMALPEP